VTADPPLTADPPREVASSSFVVYPADLPERSQFPWSANFDQPYR
jgi:hypothetical protein